MFQFSDLNLWMSTVRDIVCPSSKLEDVSTYIEAWSIEVSYYKHKEHLNNKAIYKLFINNVLDDDLKQRLQMESFLTLDELKLSCSRHAFNISQIYLAHRTLHRLHSKTTTNSQNNRQEDPRLTLHLLLKLQLEEVIMILHHYLVDNAVKLINI